MRHRCAIAIVAALLAASGTAWAHAHLKSASPAPDSTVRTAPETLSIDFTEGVEPRFSSIEVHDATGKRVDKGDVSVMPTDPKHLSVGLHALPPGTYEVIWHATAVDTHKTDGTFQFTVAP